MLLPSDPEWRRGTDREANGVPMMPGLLRRLREIAATAGAPWLLGEP